MLRKGDLTQGGITGTLLRFTLPMMVGSFCSNATTLQIRSSWDNVLARGRWRRSARHTR